MKSSKARETYADLAFCKEGMSAIVYIPARHAWRRTSAVIEITPHFDGPVFETLNTIYWPAPTDGEPLALDYKYTEKQHEQA